MFDTIIKCQILLPLIILRSNWYFFFSSQFLNYQCRWMKNKSEFVLQKIWNKIEWNTADSMWNLCLNFFSCSRFFFVVPTWTKKRWIGIATRIIINASNGSEFRRSDLLNALLLLKRASRPHSNHNILSCWFS